MLLIYPKSDRFSPPPVPIISHLDYCSILRSPHFHLFSLHSPSVYSQHSSQKDVPLVTICSEHSAGSRLIHGETWSGLAVSTPCTVWPPSFSPPTLFLFTQLQPCRAPGTHQSHYIHASGTLYLSFALPRTLPFSKWLPPSLPLVLVI